MSEYSHSELTEPAPESFVSYEKELGDSRPSQALSKEEITFLIRQEMGFYETELTSLKREQYQLRKKNDKLIEKISELENQNENQRLTISALEDRIELNDGNQALSQKTIEALEKKILLLEAKHLSTLQDQRKQLEMIENMKAQIEELNAPQHDTQDETENENDHVYENLKKKNDESEQKYETSPLPPRRGTIHKSEPSMSECFEYHTRADVEPFLSALKDGMTNLTFKVLFSKPNMKDFFKGTFGLQNYYFPRLYHSRADEKILLDKYGIETLIRENRNFSELVFILYTPTHIKLSLRANFDGDYKPDPSKETSDSGRIKIDSEELNFVRHKIDIPFKQNFTKQIVTYHVFIQYNLAETPLQ